MQKLLSSKIWQAGDDSTSSKDQRKLCMLFFAVYLEFVQFLLACALHALKLENTTLQDFSGDASYTLLLKWKLENFKWAVF